MPEDVKQEQPRAAAPLYPDQIGMSGVVEIMGLTAQRVRTLTITGKIPSAKKNANNVWCFSRAAVESYAKNRPARATDGRKMYKVKLDDKQKVLIDGALKGTGIELIPVVYKKQAKKAKTPKPAPMPGLPR